MCVMVANFKTKDLPYKFVDMLRAQGFWNGCSCVGLGGDFRWRTHFPGMWQYIPISLLDFFQLVVTSVVVTVATQDAGNAIGQERVIIQGAAVPKAYMPAKL